MTPTLAFGSLLLSAALLTSSAQPLKIADELEIPLFDGWYVDGDSDAYPARLTTDLEDAELLVYRSPIEPEGTVTNKDELKAQVQPVIDDVIGHMPGVKVLNSTGQYLGNSCRFAVEFESTDAATEDPFWNRMVGLIYRLEDDSQVMFTLWGKAAGSRNTDLAQTIRTAQNAAIFTGAHAPDVFRGGDRRPVTLAIVVGFVVAVSVLTFLQLKRSKKKSRPDEWRCGCGHYNAEQRLTCSRCGYLRIASASRENVPQAR